MECYNGLLLLICLFVSISFTRATSDEDMSLNTNSVPRTLQEKLITSNINENFEQFLDALGNSNAAYKMYIPPAKKLNPKKLFKRLGRYFNKKWMSVKEPAPEHKHRYVGSASGLEHIDSNLVSSVRQLNLTLVAKDGSALHVDSAVTEALEMWLLKRASCQTQLTWVDLGPMFWPRWMRQGACTDDTSCSWPPGMHCLPTERRMLYVLRWYCRRKLPPRLRRQRKKQKKKDKGVFNRKHSTSDMRTVRRNENPNLLTRNRRSAHKFRRKPHRKPINQKKCRWVRIPYPITAGCSCSC